jgi:hypothetical protein
MRQLYLSEGYFEERMAAYEKKLEVAERRNAK